MQSKLTLKLKKKTIERGKAFASKKNTSLSRLIENYLDRITAEDKDQEISPLVKSLSGVLKTKSFDKRDYASYLQKKYK
jgi:phage gp29-like protein